MTDLLQLSFPVLIGRLTLVPMAVAGIIGLFRFRRLSPNLRVLTGLLWFVIPMNLLGFYFKLHQQSNLFLMPAYAVVELLLLALTYRLTLQSVTFSRAMPWLVIGFTAYVLFDSLVTPTLKVFRPGQQVMQGLLVLSFVGLYLRSCLS